MSSWITVKPLQIVLRWQIVGTIAVTVVVALLSDMNSAISAGMGGLISVISSAAFAIVVSRHQGYSADGTIRTALKAEAVKISLTIVLLWLVFMFYENLNALAFIGTFIVIVIMHSLALFASDGNNKRK